MPQHKTLNPLLSYWNSKRVENKGRIPKRSQIRPSEMINFLPYLILIDVLSDPLDFRYRLIGTGICYYLKNDYTGLCMSEIPHQKAGTVIWKNCKNVVINKKALFPNTPYVGPKMDFNKSKDLLLPLSSDGENVDIILIGVEFEKHIKGKELCSKVLAS